MRKALTVKAGLITILFVGVLALVTFATEDNPAVTALNMDTQSGSTKFVIEETGSAEVQDFVLSNPRRLILDFVGAKHGFSGNEFPGDGRYVERIRTSQFMDSPNRVTRVVFDMNEGAEHRIIREANKVIVEFFSKADRGPEMPLMAASTAATGAGAVSDAAPSGTTDIEKKPAAPSAERPVAAGQKDVDKQPRGGNGSSELASLWRRSPRGEKSAPVYSSQGEQGGATVSNRRITIDVQNAGIQTVLQSFSEFSGVNIIAGPEVTGEVTAHLKNMPWRQALHVLLKSHGFGYQEEYGVIRVSTMEKLTKEELEKRAAERKKDELLPLVTKIVPLSYANADEMRSALKKIVSQRGTIEVEKGSNSLVVTDIAKNVDKIEMMARTLDRKVRQVEIVAKLVDVDVGATTELGIRWDFLNLSPAGGGVIGDAVIDAGVPAPIGKLRIGTVRSWGELRAVVDMLEQANKANIISNPRIVTADNREASILVGKEIPLIVADEAGNPITELTKVGIALRVTPHINQDNTITLDLHPEVSELSAQATVQGGVIISISEADTRVMVGDGETAVIGGLMSQVESTLERGIPVLKDVPVLGNLFKYKNESQSKRELIIFITPRIVSALAAK